MEESVKRYLLESFRWKYHRGSKKDKGEVLAQVCEALKCHRKHAIRLMKKREAGRKPASQRRGRKSKYDSPEFLKALHKVRRVMEFRNAEVMKANMPEWLPFIERHYGELNPDISCKLRSISAATMKRYFKRMREQGGKGLATTRPGSILRNEIPIQTASPWDATVPGQMATDTVAHCGNSTEGQFIFSLDMICPATHWCAQRATWGKGSTGVLEQTKDIEKALPFALVGLHVDNGSEFLNHHYVREFTSESRKPPCRLTRSRPNQKNDNCYVEQKNWSVVRRYFGYDRFDFQELVPLMNDLYRNELYLYLNHFCRTFKLSQKIAIKSRYKRIYGDPETPYERVLKSEHVSDEVKLQLRHQHENLDPVALKLEIERKLRAIFALYKKFTMARRAASAA